MDGLVWKLFEYLGAVFAIFAATAAIYIILKICLFRLVVKRISNGKRPYDLMLFGGTFLKISQMRAVSALESVTEKFQFNNIYGVFVYKFSFYFLQPCFINIYNNTIYIQQRFIDNITDDELQWLLAHEIGHVELNLGCETNEIHMIVDKFAAGKLGCEAGITLLRKSDEIYGLSSEKTVDGFTAINLEIEKRIQYLKSLRK